ncbi:Copine-8 [Trichoplax sp. H2]|nr:Copine-8 [Trichoplax sp. H2]|eukprot:RDD40590.1 Copine-8 [Trichoplax sp. H2]
MAGEASSITAEVTIRISCRNVPQDDLKSKPGMLAVVNFWDEDGEYIEYGRTEVVLDNLNPRFAQNFPMAYYFEQYQRLKFEVFAVDASGEISEEFLLGDVECTLGILLSNKGNLAARLGSESSKAEIIIDTENNSTVSDLITLQINGTDLDKKDFLGKSDPYLEIMRKDENDEHVCAYQTEVIKNTLNPKWDAFIISAYDLCEGDYSRPIKISCYDWNRDGNPDYIGECMVSVDELKRASASTTTLQLINEKKKNKKKKYKNSGELHVVQCEIEPQPIFVDYIKNGTQINCTVGVDFTASNGNPRHPSSLHYNDPDDLNVYQRAIVAVGAICQDYDTDKMFPALGFGAKLSSGVISHDFFLNGSSDDPNCDGIEGVLEAYKQSLSNVQLYGPTNFAPIISHVSKQAQQADENPGSSLCFSYQILLMVTDGIISDMDETKLAVIKASGLPMSIIIVGVGDTDFDEMDELDSDEQLLSFEGNTAERDIVQFVEFQKFLEDGQITHSSAINLAREVLAEVPRQILEYMRLKNVAPNKSN